MDKVTVKPKDGRVFNSDTKRYIESEQEVLKGVSVRRSIKKGELVEVEKKKAASKPVKTIKKDQE